MANLLEQAINCDNGDLAAKIIQHALGIESDDVANYCFRPRIVNGELGSLVIG
jgi:hypothetical protein